MKDARVNPDGSITVGIIEEEKPKTEEKPEKPTKKKKAVKK